MNEIGLLPISKKGNWEIKKNLKKKKFIAGDKKNIFPGVIFCLFFSSPSVSFFLIIK